MSVRLIIYINHPGAILRKSSSWFLGIKMITTKFLSYLRLQLPLFLILLVISIYGACSNLVDNGVKCRPRERTALLKFKAELIDDYGLLSTWGFEGDDETNCCKWKGVLCDNQTNHVVALDLHGPFESYPIASLRGNISPSLLELAHLNYLDLSFNDFNQSQIPEFIGFLGKLQHLNLSFANFGGPIPHYIGNLSMLQLLDLSYNFGLTDTNLDWFSGLQSLEYLDLSYVDLQRATTWPQAINKLVAAKEIRLSYCYPPTVLAVSLPFVNSSNSLVVLDLSANHLEGRIPDAFGNLMSLSHLDLRSNNLDGSIPDALGNMTSLSYLDLSGNNLEGRIPDALGNLMSLSHLDLRWNQLQGEFPQSSKNWSSLEYLDLAANDLRGSLPNMSRFSVLRELSLHSNQLNGSLIESNLRLPNLEVLDLSKNKFTGAVPNFSSSSMRSSDLNDNTFNGTLTESIGCLPKVEYLYLGSNRLEGLVTEAHFSNLFRLKELDLSFNLHLTVKISPSWKHPFQFKGLWLACCKLGPYFPKWLQKQNQVEYLDISNAGIVDAIPGWFWDNFQMCEHLNMSHNQIFGVLPHFLSKSKLLSIDLSSNKLSGLLPLLPQIIYNIDLSGNKFQGTILNFCNFKNLYLFLDVSDNLLSGEIPRDCFMNLLSLAYLNLANNNFSGELPNSNDFYCRVSSLHLRNNSFRGEIPSSLKNCGYLDILDLGQNEFTGKISNWLGEGMQELSVLSLNSNMLYGSLPLSLCHLAKLQVLDISKNKITGTIPTCLNNFTLLSNLSSELESYSGYSRFTRYGNGTGSFYDSASVMWKGKMEKYINTLGLLKLIDLSSNELTGEIPHEVVSLIGLLGLNLSRNNLVGSIPHDIDQLKLLNFLDLSRNNLSGGIPPTLSQLSHLGVLDFSFNNLSGRIPWDTHLQTFGASTYLGNPGLCGPPLVSRPCPEDRMSEKPTNRTSDSEHEDKFITGGFYISMALGFIVAFWGVFWTLFLSKGWNIAIVKMFICIEDWLYVKVLVNKRRLMRCLGNT